MGKTSRPKTRQWKQQANEKKRLRMADARKKAKLQLADQMTTETLSKKSKTKAVKAALTPKVTKPVIKSEPSLVRHQQEQPLNLTTPTTVVKQLVFTNSLDHPIDLTILKSNPRQKSRVSRTTTTATHHQTPIVLPYCSQKFPAKNQCVNLVKPLARKYSSTATPSMNGHSFPFEVGPRMNLTPSPAHASTFSRPLSSYGPPASMAPQIPAVFRRPLMSSNVHQAALPWTFNNNNDSVAIKGREFATTDLDALKSSMLALQTQSFLPFMLPFLNPQFYPSLFSIAGNNPLGFGIPNMFQPGHPSVMNPNFIHSNTPKATAIKSYAGEQHDDKILANAAKLITLPNGDNFFIHPHYGLHKLPQSVTLDKIPMSSYSSHKVQADYFRPEFLELFEDGLVLKSLNANESMTTVIRGQKPVPPESRDYKNCIQHLQQLQNDDKIPLPPCNCDAEEESAPIYANLGTGPSLLAIRELIEKRTGVRENAIRVEKIIYAGVEARTPDGCPLAKYVLRRTSSQEKFLVLARYRPLHKCRTAWMIVAIVAWDGIHPVMADRLYNTLSCKLANFGAPRRRGCEQNDQRSCLCQGTDDKTRGMSLSFGCTYSTYYDCCKYTRSTNAPKFKLNDESEEPDVEELLQSLATKLAPVYQKLAPYAYANQVMFEEQGIECRLGRKAGRPWSGVTTCLDFCAHSHKDVFNMLNGSTGVVTLTRHRGFLKADDEQLHVLPMYTMDSTKLGPGVELHGVESVQSPVFLPNLRAGKRKGDPPMLQQSGGVAFALTHGSLLFECARHELHASTALKSPNRLNPARLSLVYYQHKRLNSRHHGFIEHQIKLQQRNESQGVENQSTPKKQKQTRCKKT